MTTISNTSEERLNLIKKTVENAHSYFEENYKRYKEFYKLVFKSGQTEQDRKTLKSLGKPDLEFNILESFVSRLRGEFAKQQPSLSVRASDGVPLDMVTDQLAQTIEVVEAHLRAVFFDAANDNVEYDVFSNSVVGGFSVFEVYTEYVNEMSMEQTIRVDRVFDPTLCGFDPLARQSHKGDGRFCFQLYPKTKKEFEEEYGKEKTQNIKYTKSVGGFSWSYKGEGENEKEAIILICDFYEKKRKKAKLFKLSNGKTMLEKDYKKYLEDWEEKGELTQPFIVVSERQTYLETIVRYRLYENEILDYVETNYRYLPLAFVDGNSAWITEGETQSQMTRPYVYHAKGIQRLKNFAGQTLANELENLVQHKFKVAMESIPESQMEAYINVQIPSNLLYHHVNPNNPDQTLPPPQEIHRTPIPPEVSNAFRMSDEMTQVILGSYDSAMGASRQEISGAAIAMGAMQSNNASVPYIVGYIKGLNRVAQILVDLIPKYYRTPRSLPILLPNGKREMLIINAPRKQPRKQMSSQGEEGQQMQQMQQMPDIEQEERQAELPPIMMDYDPHSLQVKVSAGVNFAMQKELALKTMISLMQASPRFAEFMNNDGLSALLDNIDIRGIDGLKAKAVQFEKQSQQKQQQMGKMQEEMVQTKMKLMIEKGQADVQKASAEAIKAVKEAQGPTKAQVDLVKLEQDAKFKTVQANQSQEELDMEMVKVEADLQTAEADHALKEARIDAEEARTQVEMLHTTVSAAKMLKEMNTPPVAPKLPLIAEENISSELIPTKE